MIGGCGLILARIRVCCEALLSSVNAGAGAVAVGWLLFVVDSPSVRDEVDGADSVEEADTSFSIRKLVEGMVRRPRVMFELRRMLVLAGRVTFWPVAGG